MPDYSKIYLYRMTHIENIPHILQHGITHSSSPNANRSFVPIGDKSLITTRSQFPLDNGKLLGDYIPFYFGTKMPMLYVIQKGYNFVKATPADEIVYCVTSVQKVLEAKLEYIFTDGHAVNSFSTQYNSKDIGEIDKLLDMKAIHAKYWNDENDLDLKRRKEAEFLVLGDVSNTAILGYVVYNESIKQKLLTFGAREAMVHIKSQAYF